jgi:hypothetical protein
MDTTIPPIYLVGGSKGGVGKSFVSLALADYLQRQDMHAALVETDTANPDVMKAVQDEIHCVAYSLDEADGWIGLVNFCDGHRDAAVIVNTAARNQAGVARLELLHGFSRTFPDAVTHVVRNGYFGTPDKFTLYQTSELRKTIETKGKSLDFPELADRVADELRGQRLSIRKATETMHIGERAELVRWRALCGTMFARAMVDG